MNTIWEFTIENTGHQTLQMPSGAHILSAQFQADEICLWALVNTENDHAPRDITIIGTGHPIDPDFSGRFIGTVQQDNFVWHVFETKR